STARPAISLAPDQKHDETFRSSFWRRARARHVGFAWPEKRAGRRPRKAVGPPAAAESDSSENQTNLRLDQQLVSELRCMNRRIAEQLERVLHRELGALRLGTGPARRHDDLFHHAMLG